MLGGGQNPAPVRLQFGRAPAEMASLCFLISASLHLYLRIYIMKRIAIIALLAGLPQISAAAELPLKRVVLSASGLAQFTHSGNVGAGTVIELPVRLDQVDDVLKSLTVFDASGAIGAVSLPGKTPLAELFRDLSFNQQALESQSSLLNALAGAEVEIEGAVAAKGRIFRIEEETAKLPDNGGQIEKHRLTLVTDKGFVQAILEDVTALRFTDPQLRAQIDRALSAIAQNRAKDQRTIAITLTGQNAREAGFSYVVSAPVWKTAYRIVLPKEGGKARLQGWGILENLTGGEWKDVELTLVSGNPVALKQLLYSAVFVDRPEIPVTASARFVPRKDDAEAQERLDQDRLAYGAKERRAELSPGRVRGYAGAGQKPAPAPQAAASVTTLYAGAPGDIDSLAAPALAAETEEAATQVLYRFPSKVTLASGATMMIPFVDREVAASRTYLYQPDTNAHRPLAAIRLKNGGDSALPAGLVTAFETAGDGAVNFAGDAQLPLLPRGASKFVTFALDSRTAIRRSDQGVKQTRLGKSVRGELTLTVKSVWTIEYEITPPAEEDREIIIEEQRQDGWKATADAKDLEETPSRLRYTVTALKGKTTKAALVRERVNYESVTLTSLAPDRLITVISGLQNQTPAVKDTVAKLGVLAGDISKSHAQKRELEAERKKIGEDQDRIRKNLTSAGADTDLGRRYLNTLKTQEDRLAGIAAEEKSADQAIATKTKAAEDLAEALVL
jgi:hypothetical protein